MSHTIDNLNDESILNYGKYRHERKKYVLENRKGYVNWIKKKFTINNFNNIRLLHLKLFWIYLHSKDDKIIEEFEFSQIMCNYCNDEDCPNSAKFTIKCPICRNDACPDELKTNIKGLTEECDICFTEKKEVYQPCGHIVYCKSCLLELKRNAFREFYLKQLRCY